MVKRCLVKAGETTIQKQSSFTNFEDLSENNELGPVLRAEIFGPMQDGKADFLYKPKTQKRRTNRLQAIGFEGTGWTNVVLVNGVVKGFSMLFTNVGQGKYLLDVFNENNIGVGLLPSSWKDIKLATE